MIFICNHCFLFAQCDCPDYLLDASLENTTVLPFCDQIGVNTTLSNVNGDDCDADLVLRISFATPSESNDLLMSFNYLGDLPLLTDEIFLNGQLRFRRFSFLASDIPDAASFVNLLRFSLTPDTFFVDPVYTVFVDAIPQDSSCISVFDPEIHTFTSAITIASGLTETPISGKVSDLIATQRLLSNSASNSIVEKKTISGYLEVDTDYSFDGPGGASGRPQLYLASGTEIRVKSGSTLTLTNADIFTCDHLAQGIVLESGAALVMDGSIVSDSRFGIDAQAGSTISVLSTNFIDNYIGARFNMTGAPNRVTIKAFENNNFMAGAGLKTPFSGMPEQVETRGYCGIWLNQYLDFNIWGDQQVGVPDGNHFSSLANGIIASASTGNLGNLTFSDMNSVDSPGKYSYEGFGIRMSSKGVSWFNINEFWTTMTFDNCKTGIYAANYALNVENTVMDSVDIGIDVSLSKIRDIVLDGNTITARKYGIRSFRNEPLHPASAIRNNTITVTTGLGSSNDFSTGIRMEETGAGFFPASQSPKPVGWKVSGNDIVMKEGGRGILYRNGFSGSIQGNDIRNESEPNDFTGIRTEGAFFSDFTANTIDQSLSAGLGTATALYSSGGIINTFQCNCVDNTNVGMQFFDMADFKNAVRGNNFNTHCTGLQIGVDGAGGAYIGDQNHTGNLWDLNAISGACLGGRNWGNPGEITQSEFRVNGTANASLNPAVFPSSNWFFNLSGSTYSGCSACSFPPQIPPRVPENDVPTELDHVIAKDSLDTDTYSDEMAWKGRYRLYRKMLRQPAIESYASEYASFASANENLSSGELAYIAEEKARLFDMNAAEDSILESYRVAWYQGMEALRQMDSLRQAGITINQTQYNSRVQQSADTQLEYEQYTDSLRQARSQSIQSLLTLNAAVTTTLTPDANQKTVNTIVLNLLLSDTLANGDLSTLSGIAEQCPLEGGDAVYEARAVAAYFTGADYDDLENCVDAERQQRRSHSDKPTEIAVAVIYPNPTSGHIFWNGTNDQTITVRVFNALGQLAMELSSTNASANLESLPEGLYLVQLSDPDNVVPDTQKVLIIKH